MKQVMKYIIPSILLTMTSGFAAEQNESCAPDPCCPPPCPPKDPCAKCAQLWPTCGPDWIITPNAGPCVSNGADIFITTEFIYWTVRQDSLGFAFSNQQVTGAITNGTEKGSVFHPDWRLEPGFKVGIGMMFDCDGWDLYANYTWLRTRNTKESKIPKGNLTLTNLGWITSFGQLLTSVEKTSAEYEHDFNVIDLELGRNCFISQCLHLRPHFGFKGTWQEQRIDLTETGTAFSQIVNAVGNYDNEYWGVGLRAGLDSAWHFTRSFSLVSEVAASVLWGQFDSEAKVFDQNASTNLFNVTLNVEDTFHTLKPVLELYIGLRWEDWFCCDEYHYSLEAGWELQWWGGQSQFMGGTETRWGDLGMQGLTVKLRFDF
ncbi:MAG: hypothetical protein K1000chlam2_01275 [Chlamydiae bacterium]|nr:hypothetical protein [Chlamydiota bacterium]